LANNVSVKAKRVAFGPCLLVLTIFSFFPCGGCNLESDAKLKRTLNVVPLAGVTVLGLASWIGTKHMPKWGWILAGIYILGPVSMLSPLAFARIPSSPADSGGNLILVLLCLFPPSTLWFSLLNGMLFSVLIVTVTLPFLAVYLRGQGLEPGSPVSQ
jgi:hypothetical protein